MSLTKQQPAPYPDTVEPALYLRQKLRRGLSERFGLQ